MQNELVPHPDVVVNNWKGYLGYGVPPVEQGVSDPQQPLTPAKGSNARKRSPHNFFKKNFIYFHLQREVEGGRKRG